MKFITMRSLIVATLINTIPLFGGDVSTNKEIETNNNSYQDYKTGLSYLAGYSNCSEEKLADDDAILQFLKHHPLPDGFNEEIEDCFNTAIRTPSTKFSLLERITGSLSKDKIEKLTLCSAIRKLQGTQNLYKAALYWLSRGLMSVNDFLNWFPHQGLAEKLKRYERITHHYDKYLHIYSAIGYWENIISLETYKQCKTDKILPTQKRRKPSIGASTTPTNHPPEAKIPLQEPTYKKEYDLKNFADKIKNSEAKTWEEVALLTGYKETTCQYYARKARQLGYLTRQDTDELSLTKDHTWVYELRDDIKSKKALDDIKEKFAADKITLNNKIHILYDKGELTTTDTLYLKEKNATISRYDDTKKRIIDFLNNQIAQKNPHATSIKDLCNRFNKSKHSYGDRWITTRIFMKHVAQLKNANRLSSDAINYYEKSKDQEQARRRNLKRKRKNIS